MSLPGNAFLAMWHDIEPDAWTEYMEWHTREHMPERLSIPGFLVGKRLISEYDPEADRVEFQVEEDLAPGEYRLDVTGRDRSGNETRTSSSFRVR